MWHNRQVYNDTNNWQWNYKDTTIYCETNEVVGERTSHAIEWNKAGMICYGPYIKLDVGQYQLEIQLGEAESKGIEVVITADAGQMLIFQNYIQSNSDGEIIINFSINEELSQIEFRLYSTETTPGKLMGYRLQKQKLETYIKEN